MSTETLEAAYASTQKILANVTPDQLDLDTPCASWKVRDLINHFVGVGRWSAVTVNTGTAPDYEAADYTSGDMSETYAGYIKESVAAFGAPGAQEKTVTLPFGAFPASAYMQIITTDAFVHGWDLAKATGQSTDIEPALAAQLFEGAKSFIPDAFRGDDGVMPFGAQHPAPANATKADELAAFLGRSC